jgi:uncharacterized protein YdeI (YjbR/CyaY-like superfamily)
MNTTSVDAYLQDGCGRCDLYRTPACKVHRWTGALVALRELLLAAGLTEEMKWGSPCYTLGGKNVVMLLSLKGYCAVSFFKGAVLEDVDGVLVSAGPNSRHARALRFTSLAEVVERRDQAAALVAQAIALERSGVKVEPTAPLEPVPDELARLLATEPELQAAFDALTPGRRRSHILHIAGAKQAATRAQRVTRSVPVILAGRGHNER